jgi:hypothetical protein
MTIQSKGPSGALGTPEGPFCFSSEEVPNQW